MACVTDDERHRVAERLRGLNGNTSHIRRVYEDEGLSILCDDQADYYQIVHAVTGYLPAEHMHPCDYEELHARLADLIEPAPTGSDKAPTDSRTNCGTAEASTSQVPKFDRDALLALADEMGHPIRQAVWNQTAGVRREHIMAEYARRIREACGEVVA